MRCATGKVEITPDFQTQLSGDLGVLRWAEQLLEALFARIMILEEEARRMCVVSLDLTIADDESCRRLRRAIAGILGCEEAAVMIHVVQNHTAPALGHFMLDKSVPVPEECEWMLGAEQRYTEMVLERVIDAVPAVAARLEPVSQLSGRALEGRFCFNRRAVDFDNGIFMPGPDWSDGREPRLRMVEGPVDPEVGVIAFRNREERLVGMLLHHTCHPVCVYPAKAISGDWPGDWSCRMEQAMVPGAAALVVNGCCGNLNPWSVFDPDFGSDHRRMGAALAKASERILQQGEWRDGGELRVASRILPLEFREPEAAELGDRLEYYARHPEPDWDIPGVKVKLEWFLAANQAGTIEEIRRRKKLDYEISVFRIGDDALVGLPGEPFVEGQLALKLAFPQHRLFPVHCVNQYVGYVPTRRAFEHPAGRRGHEASFYSWSKLERGALARIVAAAREVAVDAGLTGNNNFSTEVGL